MLSRYIRELKARLPNLPSCLLALYTLPMRIAVWTVWATWAGRLLNGVPTTTSCYTIHSSHSFVASSLLHLNSSILQLILPLLLPLLGWIADTKLGHKRSIDVSLWLAWIGLLLQVVSECIQYATCGLPVVIARYSVSVLAFVLVYVGVTLFHVVVFACGMDQLVECSYKKARAFIHWVAIAIIIGNSPGYNTFFNENDTVPSLTLEIICIVLLTVALVINILAKQQFHSSGVVVSNPYRMVYYVLKYSLTGRKARQRNRSAFTYWEEDVPGRIDLGKDKYGGPFTEDTVETVKTFLRILAVITAVSLVFVVYTSFFKSSKPQWWSITNFKASHMVIAGILLLVEFLIVPLFPKIEYFLTNSLMWLGVSFGMALAGLIYLLMLNTVMTLTDNNSGIATCTLASDSMPYLSYIVPYIIAQTSWIVVVIYVFEFVCSQAPRDMIAMITGLFWSLPFIFLIIGYLLELPLLWYKVHGPGKLTCSFWVLVVQVVLCVVGFIIYIFVARWYNWRQRETNPNIQGMVEDKYDNYLSQQPLKDDENTHLLVID